MTETVWVVRHGQRRDTVDPDFHTYADRIHDPDLTELGRWQAWRCGWYFCEQDIAFDAVYASPFLRTVQTADELCRETDHTFRCEPGLGEHRNAEWFDSEPETLSEETLVDYFDPIRNDHEPAVVPEFPESHQVAEQRAGRAARLLADQHDGRILLVGHGLTIGGVVRGLVGSTEGVDAPLCGITRIERDGSEWALDFSGRIDHLD